MRSLASSLASFAVAVAVVACSPPTPDHHTIVIEEADVASSPPSSSGVTAGERNPATAAAPARPDRSRQPRISGVPGESILVLAATDDGTAAVTADNHGVRVWPSLDGTREPLVLAMTVPSKLTIARDGDELSIAGLDRDGGLEIVRAAADGTRILRARVASERPYLAAIATARGVLALRDDQRLERFDRDGVRITTTEAAAGARLAGVVHRRGRTLALLERHDGVRGAWLTLDDTGITWGAETGILPIDPATAQLAPDRDELAGLSPSHRALVRVELATGKVRRRDSDSLFQDVGLRVRVLGYTREGLAYTNGFELTWWENGYNPVPGVVEPAVATDRAVLSGLGPDIALITIDDTQNLGYRMPMASQFRPFRGGAIVGDGRTLVRIDDELRTRSEITPAVPVGSSVVAIDKHHAIAVAPRAYGDPNSSATISWIDLREGTVRQIGTSPADYLNVEPSTGLIAGITVTSVWFGHVDTATGTLDYEVEKPLAGRYGEVHLRDPARSGMLAAVLDIHEGSTEGTLTPILELAAGGYMRLGKPRLLSRNTRFWERVERGEIDMIGEPAAIRRRSPDQTLIAELGGHKITLRDVGGGVRWSVSGRDVTDLSWTDGGELVVFGSGIAKLDLSTGALADRQCGWRFGLWEESEGFAGGAQLCDAAPE